MQYTYLNYISLNIWVQKQYEEPIANELSILRLTNNNHEDKEDDDDDIE